MEAVEPTFIKMGTEYLINLNAVKRIRLIKTEDENDAVSFAFLDDKPLTFEVDDCESILSLVKIPYTLSTK